MSTMKTQAAKAPAKATPKAPPKASPKAPAKASAKAMPKLPAKAVTKAVAKAPAKLSSQEAMLARVEAVRLSQRESGHFDCFGRASEGYCDQGDCAYHAECLSVSRLLHSM
ncbi:MAG: hypothetical protein Q8S17_05815 [Humidesulfovibrio sp.]|nr:hypothetical protein [Humidesulfovibrio sp.]